MVAGEVYRFLAVALIEFDETLVPSIETDRPWGSLRYSSAYASSVKDEDGKKNLGSGPDNSDNLCGDDDTDIRSIRRSW